jgi:predicted CXXCH cytochrome family protein
MQYNEWVSASHAQSLDTMLASDYAEDSCLACHSTDPLLVASQLASIEAEEREAVPAPIPVTLQNAQNGVTCLACHDAHPDPETGLPHQLLAESYALCTACHSDSDPSDGLHSTSQQLYEGITLIEEVAGVPSGHFAARQQGEEAPDCVGCHLARLPVDGILRASHTLQPLMPGVAAELGLDEQSCTACHAEQADGAAMQTLIEDIQASTATRLEAIQAAQGDSDPAWVGLAVQLIEGDGSQGVHNYAYTDSLLDAVEAHLGLGGQSE